MIETKWTGEHTTHTYFFHSLQIKGKNNIFLSDWCKESTFVGLIIFKMKEYIQNIVFSTIGKCADEMHQECYVIGGYVRDIFLQTSI